MSAVEISRSMLVNQGLSARAALVAMPFELNDVTAPAGSDVVSSFKQLLTDDATRVDRELVNAVFELASPLDLATFFINAKYGELGGVSGLLGKTQGAVVARGAGFMRAFQNGLILWHAQFGAHELHGPIRVRWQGLGGEGGFLGFPTSDVTAGADVRAEGSFAHFQGGSIYWTPPRRPGAGVLVKEAASLASTAALLTAVSPTPNAAMAAGPSALSALSAPALSTPRGSATALAASSLSASAAREAVSAAAPSGTNGLTIGVADMALPGLVAETSAGAFEVHGAIREKYLALGAEASVLGYPRTDETSCADGTGRFNHFQGGSIYFTPSTSAHEAHGLIRDRWVGLGAESNPALGYPISDELIPDPRIGHRRPESRKKPILSLPGDVIKLPAAAAAAGFPASVVNATPLEVAVGREPVLAATRAFASSAPSVGLAGAVGKLSDKSLAAAPSASAAVLAQPGVLDGIDLARPRIAVAVDRTPASTAAESRSLNRFADFENGVLFWFRGATEASSLAPREATSDGTGLSFSGADIAAASLAKLGQARFEGQNISLAALNFAGTTGYSFDGVQVHNRRHRLQLVLQGTEVSGGFVALPLPVMAQVELQMETWFDPAERRIALTLTDWRLTQASSGTYAAAVSALLADKLDPLVWSSFELLTLPDTDAGAPIAILSVKTLQNGNVVVFAEPKSGHLLVGAADRLQGLAPATVVFNP
jgi:LGFP repeat-containing protein